MAVYVLDHYYLAITVLVTTAYQLLGFAIAWTLQFDKITDFTGGSNFFILALLTLLIGNEFHTRNVVASVLVMVWAVRIAGFLLYRVLRTGSDNRFDEIRSNFFKFLGFWVGQILWIWTVSLPLTILNSPAISDTSRAGSNPDFGTSRDIAGIILWVLGWLIETVSDFQKFRYKMSSNKPKDKPVSTGLWKWSRHPPYFGEIICWWGIWILCISPTTNGSLPSSSKSAQYGSVVSPLFTLILLMFGSGVPTAEKPQAKKFFLMSHGDDAKPEHANSWPNYKEYLRRTSVLVPVPPFIYRPLPQWLKSTILLDFPMYRFDEGKDGTAAIEELRNNSV
ncbi:hypothetical protein GYMLUDRAFT_43625 [Collybiopsis luxurians FD-317 M1]|uniref:Steroid 5-alpha reductase C-terminal domain-containing protein n=1 Tax=Collybiopsis luxurians FD-317 M1 TaxID=944289 RepID=A0A0D0CNK4_9AGAR|nr:hypothetical protein GYMLUDRAFT_43625 [Collybiopsis luxurians FD-317 M1]